LFVALNSPSRVNATLSELTSTVNVSQGAEPTSTTVRSMPGPSANGVANPTVSEPSSAGGSNVEPSHNPPISGGPVTMPLPNGVTFDAATRLVA